MDRGNQAIESPTVLSGTAQEFEGKRYYLCGFYFQRKGCRLHRKVWERNFGQIPDGFHVHHRDENRTNNSIENLQLLPGSAHISLHADKESIVSYKARAAASAWHGSDEGRKWHQRQYESRIRPLLAQMVDLTCAHCGKAFEAIGMYSSLTKYRHPNCKARALRSRRASEREAGRLLHR